MPAEGPENILVYLVFGFRLGFNPILQRLYRNVERSERAYQLRQYRPEGYKKQRDGYNTGNDFPRHSSTPSRAMP